MSSEIVSSHNGFEQRLAFAFDCGSFNRECLYSAIDAIDSELLDLLFISHLEGDHVNGIDFLTMKKQVVTVVLPIWTRFTQWCSCAARSMA